MDKFTGSATRTDSFYNALPCKVYLLDGYGNLCTISRTVNTDIKVKAYPHFSITTSFSHDIRSNSMQIEDYLHQGMTAEQAILYERTGRAGVTLSQTVEFSLEDLTDNEIVRDTKSNFCLSLNRDALISHSKRRGRREHENTPTPEVSNSYLALNLTVVDNAVDAPEAYYVNIAGRVFRVPVIPSPNVEDGVWIESNLKQSGKDKVEFVSIKDAVYREGRESIPSVTLFTSALEAKRFGDTDAELRETSRKQEREIIDLKHNLEVLKAESAKAKAEQEETTAKTKDRYEARSHQRKDDTEKFGIVAKTLTAIVALTGAIVGFIRWLG
jgi:hypothetical protein